MANKEGFVTVPWPGSNNKMFRFIDLTQVIGPSAPKTPFPVFAASVVSELEKTGAYARMVTLNEHLGTHVDAPCHFAKGQPTIERVPLSQLIGPAAVFHIEDKVADNPDYHLNMDDVRQWENKNRQIPAGTFVLVATGWSQWWHADDKTKYMSIDSYGKEHFPGIENEVFDFLLNERDIRGVGVDCFRPEGGLGPPVVQGTMVPRHGHNLLCAAGKLIIENLRNLEMLPETGALIILGVIPYENGSAGPARIVGLVP